MVQSVAILADQPELKALAELASIAPSQMAAAFNNPERLFEYLTLEEVNRLKAACERLAVLQQQMVTAMDIYTSAAKQFLETELA